MTQQALLATLVAASACGCSAGDASDQIPIACVLTALTDAQRDREATLLQEHLHAVRQVREHDDGYSFRYASDLALFSRMAELVALEHRCCPFLDFALEWPGGPGEPWLHIRGGERVKPFVLDTFAPRP